MYLIGIIANHYYVITVLTIIQFCQSVYLLSKLISDHFLYFKNVTSISANVLKHKKRIILYTDLEYYK